MESKIVSSKVNKINIPLARLIRWIRQRLKLWMSRIKKGYLTINPRHNMDKKILWKNLSIKSTIKIK